MLGLTGASGAPYAARVLRGLADAGAEVGVCASRAGRQVIALECYGDRDMDPDGALERLVADHGEGAARVCAGESNDFLRVNLFHALKVEYWLRGLESRSASTAPAPSSRFTFAARRRELSGPVARVSEG